MLRSVFNSCSKTAIALAVTTLGVGFASQARAADTIVMCISDVAPGSNGGCNASDSVLLYSNGTTITTSDYSGTVTNGGGSVNAFGDLQYSGLVGTIHVNESVGIIQESTGNYLDLTYNVSGTSTGSLWIDINAAPFGQGNPFSGVGGATNSNTTGTFTGCYQSASVDLTGWCTVTGTEIGSTSLPGSFSSTVQPGSNPFGLGIQLQINGTGSYSTSGDLSLVPAPEPTSILLFGGALVLACGAIRRKLQA